MLWSVVEGDFFMFVYVILLCLVLFGLVLLLILVCLVKGLCLLDWVLVLDIFYVNVIVLLVLYGIWCDSDLFFEVVLLIVVFGFVGMVVVVKYMLCGDIIEWLVNFWVCGWKLLFWCFFCWVVFLFWLVWLVCIVCWIFLCVCMGWLRLLFWGLVGWLLFCWFIFLIVRWVLVCMNCWLVCFFLLVFWLVFICWLRLLCCSSCCWRRRFVVSFGSSEVWCNSFVCFLCLLV